jgi:hypothetical protein
MYQPLLVSLAYIGKATQNMGGFLFSGPRIFLSLLLFMQLSSAQAQDVSSPYDLKVSVVRAGERFQVNASYEVPITVCEAFAFITDYEGAKSFPGVVDSKVLSRAGNRVRVARLLEERILFIPFEMRSELEYVEVPNKVLLFEQLNGDTKYYKGSWRLFPDKGSTTFKYDAQVEPSSLVPSSVIEFFIKNIVRRQFEVMAEIASLKGPAPLKTCK